jgi:O-antigen/teichoic acid export membrane protein
MKTVLQWVRDNGVIFFNAGSLVGSAAVTSTLGFAFWWLAARNFQPTAVGLGSATISAMMLLGAGCGLGLGTMLVGELSRQPGKEVSLISAALILVGGLGGCIGIAFAVLAPYVLHNFQFLRANIEAIVLFALGVSFTGISLVLDQALLGLMRGALQLGRNTLFAVTKLAALFMAALLLRDKGWSTIYATCAAGNAISFIALAGFATLKGRKWLERAFRPEWSLLRKLGKLTLQHHLLNLILQSPANLLPVLVTALLSPTMNAWFYVAFMLANFVFVFPFALTAVLFATSAAQPAIMSQKARLTLGVAIVVGVLGNCVLWFGTKQLLGFFGHSYAEQAAWSLRILGLAVFPDMIKGHFIAISRIQGRLVQALVFVIVGAPLELGTAALGAHLGGLSGLSLGWVGALCIEAACMFPVVYRVIRPTAFRPVGSLEVAEEFTQSM